MLHTICEEMAEFCELLAEVPYKKSVKKLRCPTCRRLTGEVQGPTSKKEHNKYVADLKKRAKKFRAMGKIFKSNTKGRGQK